MVINLDEVDSLTFVNKDTSTDELQLTCTIDELTPQHATYTIHANRSDVTYYQFMMSEEVYNNMIEQYGSLPAHDQVWWGALAEYYTDKTWMDVMRSQLVSGTHTFESEAIIASLAPNTRYVIYYYGLNENGEMTTELKQEWFTTPKPQESTNTFEISDITVGQGRVFFVVTPSNNDTYYATAQSQSAVNQYLAQYGNMRDVAQFFMNVERTYNPYFDEEQLHVGEERIEMTCSQADTDYVIIVCGYDGGVSTDPVTATFHSQPE